MENQLSLTNLTYDANDDNKQQECYINHLAFNHNTFNKENRPGSYMDPTLLRPQEGYYTEEENYEDLSDIPNNVNDNVYETLPIAKEKEQHVMYRQPQLTVVPPAQIDMTEINNIKQDLKKTKRCLIILGLLVMVLLLVSITAVVLAVTLSIKAIPAVSSVALGPQAQIAQGSVQHQLSNNSEWINKLSSEVEWLHVRVNTSTKELNDKMGDFSNQIRENLTGLDQVLNTVKVHFNMTESEVQQTAFHVASLQSQVRNTEDDIVFIRRTVTHLQTQLNTTQTNFSMVNQQLANVRNQLTTANLSLVSTSNRITGLQTSINNRLSSPVNLYQNCVRDTSTCSVSRLINDNRRSYCSTPFLNASITVSKLIFHIANPCNVGPTSVLGMLSWQSMTQSLVEATMMQINHYILNLI